MSPSLRRVYLHRKGIYGYSGDNLAHLCWWWHRALIYADQRTLKHFVGYRGFELTESSIDRHGYERDVSTISAGMKRRPTDKSRFVGGSGSGARPRAPDTRGRWGKDNPGGVFGVEIGVDFIGGNVKPDGTKILLSVDPRGGGKKPFALCFPEVKKESKAKARASKASSDSDPHVIDALSSLAKEYEVNGHHTPVWGEPIAKLRGDFDSQFVSKETQDLCKKLRVEQMWSTPYCHEQNGLVENYVGTVFILVTACYTAASWVPWRLWAYCIVYVVHCLNLHVGEDDGCPWEDFYQRRYNFRSMPLMPFGCVVLVFVPKHLRTWKFGERGIPGIYIGFPHGIKEGVYVYIPLTGKVRIVREYSILESVPAEWPRHTSMIWPIGEAEERTHSYSHGPFEDKYLEDDLEELLEAAGQLAAAPIPEPEDLPSLIQEVIPLSDMPSAHDVTTSDSDGSEANSDCEVLVHRPDLPASGTEDITVVPTVHIPVDMADNFIVHENARWREGLDTYEEGNRASGDKDTSTTASAMMTTPQRDVTSPLQPPPVERLGEALSPAVGLMPTDGAGDVLPVTPAPEDQVKATTLSFETLRLQPLIDTCPGLAYVLTCAEENSRKLFRPTGQQAVSTRGGQRVQTRVTDQYMWRLRVEAEHRKAQHKKVRFRAMKKKRKLFNNPDKPSLSTALKGPHKQQVLDAMELELEQYTETFEAIELLSQETRHAMSKEEIKKALTSHFEIEFKRDLFTNAVTRVKARLVIHGNQVEKYSFDDIKSPTVRPAAVKLLLSMLGKETYHGKRFTARSWDIKGAFLQTKIVARTAAKQARDPAYTEPEPILLRLPDGRISRLKSFVYGLKQASYEWYETMRDVLLAAGYVKTADPCLFKKIHADDQMYICIHVDDIFSIATSDSMHDELDAVLAEAFEQGEDKPLTRHVGNTLAYLKLRIVVNEDHTVSVDQMTYIAKVIDEWGYGNGTAAQKFGLKLIDENDQGIDTHPLQGTYAPHEDDDVALDSTWYRGVVGALNYAAQMTRPDLLYAMSVLAEHANAPTRLQWRMLKRVMRYLVGTNDRKLTYNSDKDWEVTVYADASYATRSGARSQTGYCISLGKDNAVFYAKSQKQNLVTLSSTEAEYVALHHAATEVVYFRRLMKSLDIEQTEPTVIFQDNQSTILWANGQRNHARTKHLLVKYHFIGDLIQDGVVELDYLSTTEMIADILTKPLLDQAFKILANQMLGWDE